VVLLRDRHFASTVARTFLGAYVVMLGCVCARAQEPADFEKLKDQLVHSALTRNPAAAAALFTEDAQLRSPMNIRAKGSKEIEAYFAGEKFLAYFIVHQLDVRIDPEGVAIDHRLFAKKYLIPEPIEFDGRYWIVWRRVGADWKIQYFYAEQDKIPID